MPSTRSKTVFYLNDELGSYIKKDLKGNVKLIPIIRFPDSINQGKSSSFTLLLITKDIEEGQELVQSIADSSSEVDSVSKIFENNILFGEHAINNKVDYLKEIIRRFEDFSQKLALTQSDRQAELVIEKIAQLKDDFSGE